MALQAAYRQFLAAPNSTALAASAALHYVTTTTSYHGSTDIIKHLSTLRGQVKKTKEDLLNVVEGHNAIAVESETCLEFVTDGGAYLPGMDDNFVADRSVTLPILHIVSFDADGKIAQIRQSWDQGSLLKQLDIIGKSGRNWPIRDSKDQLKLITNSLKADGGTSTPYAGTRPRQRPVTEVLEHESPPEDPGSPRNGREGLQSPSRAVAPKAGAGRSFQTVRLFDADQEARAAADTSDMTQSPSKFYHPNSKRFEHFDLDDGTGERDTPGPDTALEKKSTSRSKHESQWGFDDFVTPQKPIPTRGAVPTRNPHSHWDEEEEEEGGAVRAAGPQARVRRNIKPRPDAQTHFDHQYDEELDEEPPRLLGHPRGPGHDSGSGLYKNNLYNEDGGRLTPGPDARALGNITNLEGRQKFFNPHFELTADVHRIAIIGDGMGGKKESSKPGPDESRTGTAEVHRIAIIGDGMGGKKAGRGWALGEESDEERNVPSRKQGGPQKASSFWDF